MEQAALDHVDHSVINSRPDGLHRGETRPAARRLRL